MLLLTAIYLAHSFGESFTKPRSSPTMFNLEVIFLTRTLFFDAMKILVFFTFLPFLQLSQMAIAGKPTARPIKNPTKKPTARPMKKPTKRPTMKKPTKRPTAHSTRKPIVHFPTRRPTIHHGTTKNGPSTAPKAPSSKAPRTVFHFPTPKPTLHHGTSEQKGPSTAPKAPSSTAPRTVFHFPTRQPAKDRRLIRSI